MTKTNLTLSIFQVCALIYQKINKERKEAQKLEEKKKRKEEVLGEVGQMMDEDLVVHNLDKKLTEIEKFVNPNRVIPPSFFNPTASIKGQNLFVSRMLQQQFKNPGQSLLVSRIIHQQVKLSSFYVE